MAVLADFVGGEDVCVPPDHRMSGSVHLGGLLLAVEQSLTFFLTE